MEYRQCQLRDELEATREDLALERENRRMERQRQRQAESDARFQHLLRQIRTAR
jgi:hypothetical protein